VLRIFCDADMSSIFGTECPSGQRSLSKVARWAPAPFGRIYDSRAAKKVGTAVLPRSSNNAKQTGRAMVSNKTDPGKQDGNVISP
jgi:hypothetical protein